MWVCSRQFNWMVFAPIVLAIISIQLLDSQADGQTEFTSDSEKLPLNCPNKSDMSDYHQSTHVYYLSPDASSPTDRFFIQPSDPLIRYAMGRRLNTESPVPLRYHLQCGGGGG